MADARLRLSSFAVVLPLGGERAFVGHAIRGTRLIVDGAVGRVLSAMGAGRSLSELAHELADDDRFADDAGELLRIVAELRTRGLVTERSPEAELSEARELVERAHLDDGEARAREQMKERFAPAEEWRDTPPGMARRAVVLGWCTAEALAPALREEARSRGVALEVITGFETDAILAREHDADFTLLVLGSFRLLSPLYAPGTADTMTLALRDAIARCEELVREASASSRGPLLVTGCATPQVEPLGLLGALGEDSVADRVFELNRGIRRAVARTPNAAYVDLERLLSVEGKGALLDDLVAPFSHAGVVGGASNARYHRLVAHACHDALDVLAGIGRIRCVAVDLDGVLWPGEIADPGWSFEDAPTLEALKFGLHGGLHEALFALRSRGILLAVVSKNVREGVLERWNDATWTSLGVGPGLLTPSDFASLEIGWTDKSRAIQKLAEELGIDVSAIALLDDDPRERAEVSHTLPAVWVLDGPLSRARETLLTSPRLDSYERSAEARERADTTRARLSRDRAAEGAADRSAFLSSLEVRCTLRTQHDERHLDRVAELVARTNQFRTTSERPTRREIALLARDPNAAITTLEVSDRFGRYGLTGVALSVGNELRLLTLSCRVIGAEVHQALFRAALEEHRSRAPGADVLVRFVATPHNAPTLRLFEGATFGRQDGGYVLRASAALPPLPAHCSVSRP